MPHPDRAVAHAADGPTAVCARCRLGELCRLAGHASPAPSDGRRVVARFRTLKRGDFVFRAGDAFHSLCAVCLGSVKTCAIDADGDVQPTGLYLAGEMLGMDGLADRRCHADAIALEPVRICEIPLTRVQTASADGAEWRRALWAVLALEILHGRECLRTQLGKKNASARLAAFLLHLARRHAPRGFSPTGFALHLSQAEIAAYLGLAKETVCRLFARFERQGWLRLRRGRAYVGDLDVLARIAGDPAGIRG